MGLQSEEKLRRGAILLSLLFIIFSSGCSTIERIDKEVFNKPYDDYKDSRDFNHRVEDIYTLAEVLDDMREWKYKGLTFQVSGRVNVNRNFWRHPFDFKHTFDEFGITFRIKF